MFKRNNIPDLNFEQNFSILRWLLYVINVVFLIFGALVFSAGIYVFYDQDMQDYLIDLGMDFYYQGTAALMTGACIVCLNSFIGFCSGFTISKKGLLLHIAIIVATFFILLPSSAFLLANGLEQSNLFTYIQVTMKKIINQYEWDTNARRTIDIIQEYIGCCGGYGDSDYKDIHLPIPDTCRDHVTGNQYSDSCAEVLSWFLEKRTGILCGISLCICFLDIFAVIIAYNNYLFVNQLKNKL